MRSDMRFACRQNISPPLHVQDATEVETLQQANDRDVRRVECAESNPKLSVLLVGEKCVLSWAY